MELRQEGAPRGFVDMDFSGELIPEPCSAKWPACYPETMGTMHQTTQVSENEMFPIRGLNPLGS